MYVCMQIPYSTLVRRAGGARAALAGIVGRKLVNNNMNDDDNNDNSNKHDNNNNNNVSHSDDSNYTTTTTTITTTNNDNDNTYYCLALFINIVRRVSEGGIGAAKNSLTAKLTSFG